MPNMSIPTQTYDLPPTLRYKRHWGGAVIRLTDGTSFDPDADQADAKQFRAWLAAGNSPDAADPEPAPPEPLDVGTEAADATDRPALQTAVNTLRTYVGTSSPTAAQTAAALKLTIRLLLALARRTGV